MHWQGSFHRTKTYRSRSTILSGKNTIEQRKITKKVPFSWVIFPISDEHLFSSAFVGMVSAGVARLAYDGGSGFAGKWYLNFTPFLLQSFLVNWPMFLVPGKYKALPSIQIFFAELYRNNSSGPGRDNWSLFLVFTFVVVISSNDCNKITS